MRGVTNLSLRGVRDAMRVARGGERTEASWSETEWSRKGDGEGEGSEIGREKQL